MSLSWAVLMYISYHKTSWESVAKILVENCVRPASWTKNEAGIPTQFPCYGFFGYSFEIADTDALQSWAIRVCTSNLYKIGKGQNPSGILAICRSPKLVTQMHPGPIGWKQPNSTPLCYCWHIARGKDGATAMNSKCASVSYRWHQPIQYYQGSDPYPRFYIFNRRRSSRTVADGTYSPNNPRRCHHLHTNGTEPNTSPSHSWTR